jgi:hypothetical protein
MALPKKSFLLVTFLIAFALALYVTFKLMGSPDISGVKATFSGSTQEFLNTIKEDPSSWTNEKKVVMLTGVITAKDQKGISLNESVYFRFAEGTSTDEFSNGQKVKVKGTVESYDAVLEELQLENAVLVKK